MNIATYLKIQKTKLHDKIDELETGDDFGFHRYAPLKSPTIVLTAACKSNAGRNSIERYCLATGLKAVQLEMEENCVDFSPVDGTVDFQSKVALPIKVYLCN